MTFAIEEISVLLEVDHSACRGTMSDEEFSSLKILP